MSSGTDIMNCEAVGTLSSYNDLKPQIMVVAHATGG